MSTEVFDSGCPVQQTRIGLKRFIRNIISCRSLKKLKYFGDLFVSKLDIVKQQGQYLFSDFYFNFIARGDVYFFWRKKFQGKPF